VSDATRTVGNPPPSVAADLGRAIEGASVGDRLYRGLTTAFAAAMPILLALIAFEIFAGAWPALRA
jgi:hypothetical protein